MENNNKIASETAKRWLTNPTEAPPELQNKVSGVQPGNQQTVATYRTPFSEYHQVMNKRDDAGFTWIQKSQEVPGSMPEDVQWLSDARRRYSDSYLTYLNGEISYEKFVLDNFEDDMWRMAGHDFSNPAYWYKRYMQNDFTDIRSNTAMRFDILNKSIQYAQTMDFEDILFNQTSATNNFLNSAPDLTDVAGRKVSEQTMETLLGEEWQGIKNIFNGDVERSLDYVRSSGAELQRLFYNDEDGQPAWYLHTDGKLYKVKKYDGTRQAGYASYKGDASNPTEIWIDDNNLFGLGWSAGDAFLSSFAGFGFTLATTIAQIPALAIDTVEGLATGDWTFDKVANTALIFQDIQESNQFSAKGRIDLDGFEWGSMADWGDAVGSFAGTMAGMIATAKVGGFMAKSKVAPIKKIGEILNKTTNIYSGSGLGKGVAQPASFAFDTFAKALGARTTFAVTFALKDGFNTLAQRTLVNDPQAFQKAALVTAVNTAITMALGSTKADDTAYMYKRMFGLSGRLVKDEASKQAAGRLLGRSIFTATADLFDNYLTMSLAASSATRGTMEVDWDPSRAIFATLMARNAFVGSQKTGQFISNRAPQTVLRDLQADVRKRIDGKPVDSPDRIAALELEVAIKSEIDKALSSANDKELATGSVYWKVLETLSEKMDSDTRAPIKEALQRVHNFEKNDFFREMLTEGEKLYDELIKAEQGFMQRLFLYGMRDTDGTGRAVFNKKFVNEVYETLTADTKSYLRYSADMTDVDSVAKMIYDLYDAREDFSQKDFDEISKNIEFTYENDAIVLRMKGAGTNAQADPTFSTTQKILAFAEKYGVLTRIDENVPDQWILRSAILKDIEISKDADLDENAAEVQRLETTKQELISKNEQKNMPTQELQNRSMKAMLDSINRARHTIEKVIAIGRKATITRRDINDLKRTMGRPDASTEEILQDLHVNGFIKGATLLPLVGRLGKSVIGRRSYMSKAYEVYQLMNQARENPDLVDQNTRKINSIIAKANAGDDNLKNLLDETFGEDFTKTYQKRLAEFFSQQATSDIIGEIKRSFEQANEEFLNERPIRFSLFKEDGSTKTLPEVAKELELYDFDNSKLYNEIKELYKGGSFNKKDAAAFYKTILENSDELPRRVVLQVGKESVASVFRDNVTYASEERVQVNLATIVTQIEADLFEIAARNPNMDSDALIRTLASRMGNISEVELRRRMDEQVEGLNLLRRSFPDQSLIEVSDIEGVLGRLGYSEEVFDKVYPGITALREGDVLVEIKDASFKAATQQEVEYVIPGKTNKQSQVLTQYGGTRQINADTEIVGGSIRQFIGYITNKDVLTGQTIDEIKSPTKGQTFGGKKGASVTRAFDMVGKALEDQTRVMKLVFVKDMIKEMSEGDYARGLVTYVDATDTEVALYERYWDVTRSEDGTNRLVLTNFKTPETFTEADIKYIIPLQLRTEDTISFRARANDSTYRMNFLPEFKYGTYDENMVQLSGPDNMSVHKLITSYLEFKDADQKQIIIDTLLRPDVEETTGEQLPALFKDTIKFYEIPRDADGRVQEPTITERNIRNLSRMDSSIQNDADRILVNIAKHFVELSKEAPDDVERLATDPLFRKILEEDQSNDPAIIAQRYTEELERIGAEETFTIVDDDFEREAGSFPNIVLSNRFDNLEDNIRTILQGLEEGTYARKIVYNQSAEDAFLEQNVVTLNGKKYLPVKSLNNAPEEVFAKLKGGETAREKYDTLKTIIGDERSTAVRMPMVNRDFPTQAQNKSMFVYDQDNDSMFTRVYENARRSMALEAIRNATQDDVKVKTPLQFEQRYVELVDRNEFINETTTKINLNTTQKDSLNRVFDNLNGPEHPNFVVVLKDGTIIRANNLDYNAQGSREDNALIFEYVRLSSQDPEAFDGAVIFTADNVSKNYYRNPKISSAPFDTKITDLLSLDIRNSFGEYLTKNPMNADLLDWERVRQSPQLQERLEREQAMWLSQRAARTVRDRFWYDLKVDLETDDVREEFYKIVNDAVFGRDKTVDNLNKLFFDQEINENERNIKSVMGFLTDGVPVNDQMISKANETVGHVLEDVRSRTWIVDGTGEEVVTTEMFDYVFDIVDKKTKTLLTELSTERLTKREVPSASKLNVKEIVDDMFKDLEVTGFTKKDTRDWVSFRLQDMISLSVLKNSVDAETNVVNSNALRAINRLNYDLENAKKDFEEGVTLRQKDDELIREFQRSNKLYIDTEFYTVDGKQKLLSIGFVGDDGLRETYYFRTVTGADDETRRTNFRNELKKTNLPKDVRDGLSKDFEDSLKNPSRTFENANQARDIIQKILGNYSISKRGMVLAHEGRNVEFKDLVKLLGIDFEGIRLEDTAEFAGMFRKIGPESTLSNSLDALRDEYQYEMQIADRHTALADAELTKNVVDRIIDEFNGYSQKRFEGGRLYSDLNRVLEAFEFNRSLSFDRDQAIKNTNEVLKEFKGYDTELIKDKGPVATAKTFVAMNNAIRDLSVQRSARRLEQAYGRSLEKYNLSDIKESTRTRLNSLNTEERNNFRKVLNYLADSKNKEKFEDLGKLLRYEYEVREDKFLSPNEILERLTSTELFKNKLGVSDEELNLYDGEQVNAFLNRDQFLRTQEKLSVSNPLQNTFEEGYNIVFKGLGIANNDDLRNMLMQPIFHLFAKDYDVDDSFSTTPKDVEPFGLVPRPVNKKFVNEMKTLLNDYTMRALNKDTTMFTREKGEGTNEGPYKNLVPHRSSYKLSGESSYKDIKANEAFISSAMLNKMLSTIPENRRHMYIFRDNKGQYIWSKMYVNPNDNPGKFMAIKMYVHKMDQSENVEFDTTLLKMLARDTDGDKVGFVPVSKKAKELIRGYEFASKAQFDGLNEFKSIVKELEEIISVDRQKLSVEENDVIQYVRGMEEGIDFKNEEQVRGFYKDSEMATRLIEWHRDMENYDPAIRNAKDVSLLVKLSKDVQLAGEMRKGSIESAKKSFLEELPTIKEQLEDDNLLAKSIQLPIVLDDNTAEVLAYAELTNNKIINNFKRKYNLKPEESIFRLVDVFNNRTVDFANDQANNAEYQRLLADVVETRDQKFKSEFERLEDIYQKYIQPAEKGYISRSGDYEQKVAELERLYDELDKIKDVQNNIDPKAPMAYKYSRVKVFVSSEIPPDSRISNKNYKMDEYVASIKEPYILSAEDQVLIDFKEGEPVAINKGQALYQEGNRTVRSNVNGYARVYTENGEPSGIIVYESKSIGPETKTSVVNSAVGKTVGISLEDVTRADGSLDEDIAHMLSINTFKSKKVADLATIQGFKLVEGSEDNLVSRNFGGKEYKGVILELDTAVLEDTRLWGDGKARQIDRSGFFNNIDSVFGRLEFAGDDVKELIDMMDSNTEVRAYQGADVTNSIWTMSVFAPLKLLSDSQRAQFFKSIDTKNLEITKDQFISMYNTGHMLREGIEDVLGRPLKDVTIEEVEKILKKEIKDFGKRPSKDREALLNLIWKSINGDLIELENNNETLFTGLQEADSTISKRVRESDNAEDFIGYYRSVLREAAGTSLDDEGRQIKVPTYRPILATDVADEIGSYLDYDKFLFLMENGMHRGQNAYTDIQTGFKPVSKDSVVYDERTNAISEEFYKTYPATLQAGQLRLRSRAPIDFEQYINMKAPLPAVKGNIPSVAKPSEPVSYRDSLRFLLQGTYDALSDNVDNLGMMSRLRTSKAQVRDVRQADFYQDEAITNKDFFKNVYIPGFGFEESETGRVRMNAVPNVIQMRSKPGELNFGKTARGNQNQLKQEFFAQNLIQNRNFINEDDLREAVRIAEDRSKPVKVTVPENFFKEFEETNIYDQIKLNQSELEADLKSLGLKVEEQDEVATAFMSNKDRPIAGEDINKELKLSYISSAGIKATDDKAYLIERSFQMYNNNVRSINGSIIRGLTAIKGLMTDNRMLKDFQRYYVFKYFDVSKEAEMNPLLKQEIQKVYGQDADIEVARKKFVKDYEDSNPQIVKEYSKLMSSMFMFAKEAFRNEPIADPIRLMYPSFVDRDDPTKQQLKGTLINKTVSTIELNKFDPTTLDFDPFNAIQMYASKIAKKMALDKLADNAKGLGLMDNVSTVELAREFAEREILSNPNHNKDIIKAINFLETELISKFGSNYKRYTELQTEYLDGLGEPNDRQIIESRMYAVETLIDETMARTQDVLTNSPFAKSASSVQKNYEALDILESEMKNQEFSQLLNPLKEALLLRDQLYGTLASIQTETKFIDFLKQRLPNTRITDEYMRSLESGMFVKPYDKMSLEYIKSSITNLNRPLLLRALEGKVYSSNKDAADHLGEYFFTSKPSNRFVKWIGKYSNLAVKYIMGNPLKLMDRLEYFTATDFYMLTNANPFAISKIARARRELTGYQFSKTQETDDQYADVRNYLRIVGLNAGSAKRQDFYTRSQEIEPNKLDNPITDTTLNFIEIQNNLTRYALYLQTLEDLNNTGQIKYYGNAYVNKGGIDMMKSNEEKAWAVVSSNIPLFGDLPFALRYTSPWLVFASFPMAQARHLGEWVKSYHKIIKDDVVRNDPKEFMRNAVMPAGILGLEMLLAQMIIGAVADAYNVDETTEEQWKKDDSFINIFQTMFFDKPTVRQGSANPYRIVYDNIIGTAQQAATDRQTGELREDWLSNIPIGYFNAQVLSRLNPTLKIPLEVMFETDFYGTDYRSAPYDLNYMQNMLRKVSGYVVGTQTTRAVTDALVLNRYQEGEQRLLYSIIQGIGNGVADEFGNSKTYKRDIKDFFGARTIIYGHLYGTEGEQAVNNVMNFNDIIKTEYPTFNNNSNYDPEQVNEVAELLRAAMFREEDISVVHNVLLEYLDKGASPSTLTAAINRISVSRLIERIDNPDQFFASLTKKEQTQIENALAYEKRIFPTLNEINLYPERQSSSYQRNIFIPFNEHRYMPYTRRYNNFDRPQRSDVYYYQNMNTFNPRYAANSIYERWNKRR
jgi:hypothetical protein